MLNAIVWKLRTGAPWRDIPDRYGSWKTAHERLRRWSADGTWDMCRSTTTRSVRSSGPFTSIPAWSALTSTPPGPEARDGEKRGTTRAGVTIPAVAGEAIGRSRGGLSSKIHLAVDGRGRPMAVRLTEGQAGDNPQLLPLLDEVRVPRGAGAGPANALTGWSQIRLTHIYRPASLCGGAESR
ncbi:IS5 family transposase [Cryptosporangium japonicum]|uniref:Insertion element IS402-like domain-containing protein n=1 Tax=Cryptosporangium japonicum TaxID=80872 RepID=A0ABP3DG58_9ACTN